MSGETEASVSGWTTDTLRQHYDDVHKEMNVRVTTVLKEMDLRYQQRFDASEKALGAAFTSAAKAVDAALEAAEKAVIKAEYSSEKRFEAVNEFRAQLADQAGTFVSRVEYAQAVENLKEQVAALRSVSDANVGAVRGQRTQVANVVAFCAMIGMFISLLALILSFAIR